MPYKTGGGKSITLNGKKTMLPTEAVSGIICGEYRPKEFKVVFLPDDPGKTFSITAVNLILICSIHGRSKTVCASISWTIRRPVI